MESAAVTVMITSRNPLGKTCTLPHNLELCGILPLRTKQESQYLRANAANCSLWDPYAGKQASKQKDYYADSDT